ncbi:unnamed protein product [Albugo candida]|uniref:Mitochondrial thiamine pyrophosphate carrier 1 n=1 Tax=Albugo candida TaxID=65357 RepID=A0A024G8Q2_9STRA|nr:unnamed protein product [Albugo candida]|eukprot:CCI43044.1 unnamed protein product [Albugo candida]
MSTQSEVATRQAALAGAFAGATRLIVAPFAPRSPSGKIILNQALRKTIQSVHAEEGIRAFWRYTSLLDNLRYCIIINLSYHRGNLSATALWISYSAIQFGCYQNMDRFWSTEIKHAHPTSVHVVNGAISGVLAAVLTYPLDLFRTIFAAQGVPRRYPTIPSLARSLYHTKGASGFFQGIGPTLLQIAPYMGLSFGIYSTLDRLSNSKSIESRVLTASKLFSYLGNGAVSGLVSKLAVYPIDTIKKRMQMQSVQRTPISVVFNVQKSSNDLRHGNEFQKLLHSLALDLIRYQK